MNNNTRKSRADTTNRRITWTTTLRCQRLLIPDTHNYCPWLRISFWMTWTMKCRWQQSLNLCTYNYYLYSNKSREVKTTNNPWKWFGEIKVHRVLPGFLGRLSSADCSNSWPGEPMSLILDRRAGVCNVRPKERSCKCEFAGLGSWAHKLYQYDLKSYIHSFILIA